MEPEKRVWITKHTMISMWTAGIVLVTVVSFAITGTNRINEIESAVQTNRNEVVKAAEELKKADEKFVTKEVYNLMREDIKEIKEAIKDIQKDQKETLKEVKKGE